MPSSSTTTKTQLGGAGQPTATNKSAKSDTSTSTKTGVSATGQNTNTDTTTTGLVVPTLPNPQSSSTTGTPSTSSSTLVGQRSGSAISSTSTVGAPAANNTQSPTSQDEDMGKYTTGALAGAIVGSIIGAAIITFLVTWLFFGKRNKRDQRSSSSRSRDHRSPARHGASKAVGAGMAEKSTSSSADSGYSWQAYLPQSADDRTVSNNVKTLFDQIELHVHNYYTKATVRIDSSTSQALSQFDDDTLPDSVEALMANPQTTLPTIKHCIATALLDRMSPDDGRVSLLPEYLSAVPKKLNNPSMTAGESTAAQQAYSQWRVLNAYLHPEPEQDRNYQSRREAAAQEISEHLSNTFALWQGPKENLEGLKMHEKSLVMKAGNVACLIMSQASAYDFRWSSGQGASGRSIAVFPGFWKTTDERGRSLEQSQSLVAPVFARA